MVKVRYTHLQTLDPKDLQTWINSLSNAKFKDLLKQHYPYYFEVIFQNDKLVEEAKLEILTTSCELVEMLDSLQLDEETLLAAYYLPVVSNGIVELRDLHQRITPLMYRIIHGVVNMSTIDVISTSIGSNNQTNQIRELLLTMASDFRSIIIKLAERIVFLRGLDTNKTIEPDRKAQLAKNLHDVYSSLANRLGIGQLKWEIEDLCLKIYNPEAYYKIVKSLGIRRIDRIQMTNDFVAELKQKVVEQCHIPADQFEVYGRPKHIYSIHKKMNKKQLKFEDLYDLFAARIIVKNVEDCYKVLSMTLENYEPIGSEYTDYIANPKPNGYQSIHTIIKFTPKFCLELQIRTEEMHHLAEEGVAAHWQYKEGKKSNNKANDKVFWIRKLLEWQSDIEGQKEKDIEKVRKELLDDRIYIFTPRGEVRDLVTGSTPLDFAYSIHTEVGHRCIGAKVNNKIVNFSYQLKTGDKVEILTQKEPNISRDWINFVKTPRAKAKIQSYFSKLDRDKFIADGNSMLEQAFTQAKLQVKNFIPQLLQKFKQASSYEDLCLNVGNNSIKINTIQGFIDGLNQNDYSKAEEADHMIRQRFLDSGKQKATNSSKKNDLIIIEGSKSMMYSISKCCQPIPSDPIAGYITKGRGISVHKKDCPHLKHLRSENPARIVDCQWNNHFNREKLRLFSRFQVIGLDRVGMLRDVTAVISTEKVTISSFKSKTNPKTMLATLVFEAEFNSVESLNRVLIAVTKVPGVVSATRL